MSSALFRTALALGATLAPAGCASARSAPTPASCESVTGTLAAGTSLEPLAGRFVLTMVGGRAPTSRTAAGYLTLRVAPPTLRGPGAGARTAFVGTTDILLETVGALRLGDTGADDPAAPGVAVYEQRAADGALTVTARVGSQTTAEPTPGLQQIEGAFTVLFIRRIGAGGFAGGWQSGSGRLGQAAQGHFCAVRVGA